MVRCFQRLPIRFKLLLSYSLVFILTVALGSYVMVSLLRKTMEANIENELTNSTAAILNMVRTAASVSIKNHLRAVAEKNLEMVWHIYRRQQAGEIGGAEARREAAALLLSQRIGSTGYIACVSSRGVMQVHPQPSLVGSDITRHPFVQEMIQRRDGYIDEYLWQNPGEREARPKALYMSYFAPWDWIINVSSYRDEFTRLVNVDDFRDGVLAMRFGRSGYSYVTDTRGNIVIHPGLQVGDRHDPADMPEELFRRMLARRSGKLEFLWRGPGEAAARRKLVIFNFLPEYDWVVISSIVLDEYYSPLQAVSKSIIITMFASVVLVLPITFLISASITHPLGRLILRLGGDGHPAAPPSGDEVGQLTDYFDAFMERLEKYSRSLREEIAERKQAEESLRCSEERYRSVMEAAPDPIIVYDMQGRVIYLNRAFSEVFGWTLEQCQGCKMDHFVPADAWEETRRGLATIASGEPLPAIETRRLSRAGGTIEVSIRGAVYRDREGRPAGSVIIHRDITEIKRLEREVMEIGEQERQRIAQDLHDDLCPHLIGIEGLGRVQQAKLEALDRDAAGLSATITRLLQEAIAKTRQLARGLCPVHLEAQGLEAALRELAERTTALLSVPCEFQCERPVLIGDNTVATHLFYIAQEAVHNAVRHSGARRIAIALASPGDALRMSVSDDGRGLPAATGHGGMGQRIMGYRAKMIHALLAFESPGPLGGATVRVVLARGNPGEER